jgi:DNA-binding transcriptional LysR family regulator
MSQNLTGNRWDALIDAVSASLGLGIEESWKPAVRANLEVTLQLAKLVDEFPLPDEIEPAEIYEA